MLNATVTNIDEYIAAFPATTQQLLEQIRATIKKAAPSAEEAIKYGIPTFTLNGNLVHFAGYKAHIGFYPGPDAVKAFEKELASYKTSTGAVQFPVNKPVPFSLIKKIVSYRVKQNAAKSGKK